MEERLHMLKKMMSIEKASRECVQFRLCVLPLFLQ